MKSPRAVFSLVVSTTGKSVFKLVEYLPTRKSLLIMSPQCINGKDVCLISVHFMQIVLPLHLYGFKAQSLAKRMYMICYLLPVEFSTIPVNFRRY